MHTQQQGDAWIIPVYRCPEQQCHRQVQDSTVPARMLACLLACLQFRERKVGRQSRVPANRNTAS